MFATINKKILKKMSYLSDQKGIVRRYRREKNNWEQHLENSKKFILKSVQNQSKKSIAILGSGWCLDVPLDEISKLFSEVYLIDIFHPSEIQKKAKKLGNIFFIDADITNGMIENVFNFVQKNKKNKTELSDLDSLLKIPQITLNEFDFVVSLNILNQLDILLLDYLSENCKIQEQNLIKIRQYIQDYHYDVLPIGKSCLITDYEEIMIDKKHQVFSAKSLLYTTKINIEKSQKWIWDFDTKMRYHDQYFTKFNVLAFSK